MDVSKHAPLAIRPDGSLFQLRWMWQMLRNCDASHYAMNKSRMVRIAEYSRDCIRQLRQDTGIEYEGRQGERYSYFVIKNNLIMPLMILLY